MTLVTAFEPFGGAQVNASWEAARLWAASDPSVRCVRLPVVRGVAPTVALAALRDASVAPSLMFSLGEAGPWTADASVRLEKVAINWDDFRIPDNAGAQPRDTPIRSGSPDARFATLPVARIADALAGNTALPVTVSLSAGAFLCNHVAYALLDSGALPCPFAFVHVPAWRPDDGPERLEALVATLRSVHDAAAAR
jgi:pyroglutamyl-peptidase